MFYVIIEYVIDGTEEKLVICRRCNSVTIIEAFAYLLITYVIHDSLRGNYSSS